MQKGIDLFTEWVIDVIQDRKGYAPSPLEVFRYLQQNPHLLRDQPKYQAPSWNNIPRYQNPPPPPPPLPPKDRIINYNKPIEPPPTMIHPKNNHIQPQWRVFIIWAAILAILFLASTLLGCAASKPTKFKNSCGVKMVG